jgi:phosphoribosylanthranilate isomerase
VTLVKVCGLRTLPEARAAVQAGANWLGFIFWQPGKRFVPPEQAAEIIRILRQESAGWSAVGVFVDPFIEDVVEAAALCGLDYVQLSGDESAAVVDAMPRPAIKAIHVRAGQEAAAADVVTTNALRAHIYLLDTHADGLHGGTGTAFDWAALQGVGPQCLVAGGLRPDNVATALATLAPFGVDVSSGVEFSHPQTNGGGKDPRLIQAFLEAVRSYDKRAD